MKTSIGQTALSAGDIAITSFNSDTDDEISFILLKDITTNTKIYLTENGWDDDADNGGGTPNWVNTNEGTLEWTSTSAMKAGAQIQITTPKLNATLKVSEGNIVKSGTWSLVSTSDSIIIYQGTAKPTDGTEVTQFIWAFNTGSNDWTSNADSTSTTGIPTGLTDGVNAISFNGVTLDDNLQYNCHVTSISNITTLRASLATESNYITNSSNPNYKAPICITTSWNGSTDSVWSTVSNWSDGVPAYAYNVTIPNVATSPIISSGTKATAGNITIAAGESLTINNANALTTSGAITITGDLTINGGGSIIVYGSVTGNLNYNVTISDTNWHLVSSPVVGEQYDDSWNTTNSINVSGTGNNDAVSTYNNTTSATGSWDYFQTGSAATTFNQGIGYSLKRTAAGNYGFIGTFPTDDILLTITQGFGSLNKWNLIGNPFPSYIKVSDLISLNASNLTDTHEFVYVWNGTNYIPLLGTDYIHPGQSFFVNADNSTANNFTITESLQSHQTGVTFYKGESTPSIKVIVTDEDDNQEFTKIRYAENTTKGLDRGFDAGTFTGQSTSFSLFTHLVSNSEEVNFMQQSLPKDNYENTIIPLGLKAVSGKEITFSINHQNLPKELMVFLEDKEKSIITRLDEKNSNYKVILDNVSSGIGRFYLHTSTTDIREVLNLDNHILQQIDIYLTSERNLKIDGLNSDKGTISVYNILGEKVFHTNLKSNKTIDIILSKSIKQGIYIVNLKTVKGIIKKKIFLK